MRPLRAILLGEFGGAGEHALGHDPARFEFHYCARGDDDFLVGFLRIAADSLFREAGLEDAEVAKFHAAPGGKRISDGIEGVLDDGKNLLLNEAGFFGDRNDEVALGQVGHGGVVGYWERLCNPNRRTLVSILTHGWDF